MSQTQVVSFRANVSGATLSTVTSGFTNVISIIVYGSASGTAPAGTVGVWDAISGITSGALVWFTSGAGSLVGVEIPCQSGVVVQCAATLVAEILYSK